MEFNLKNWADDVCQDAMTKGIVETILKDSPVLQTLPFIPIEGNTLTYWQERTVAGLALWRSPGEAWEDEIDVTSYDAWAGSEEYTLGQIVRAVAWNNYIYECTHAGTSAASPEPTWPTVPGQTVIDNDVVWTCRAARLPMSKERHANLKILGGDVDFDLFAMRSRPNVDDYKAALLEIKAKAMRHEFEDTFIKGDLGTYPKEFDGLEVMLDGSTQEVFAEGAAQANGAPLSLGKFEELIDKVKGGPPALLLMSKRSRRDLNKLCRAAGAILATEKGMFGEFIQIYNSIAIGVSDWILNATTVGNSTDCSEIYAFQMSEQAVSGIAWPEMIVTENIGKLEGKDAERIRLKWYVSMALFSLPRAAMLSGVRPVA